MLLRVLCMLIFEFIKQVFFMRVSEYMYADPLWLSDKNARGVFDGYPKFG